MSLSGKAGCLPRPASAARIRAPWACTWCSRHALIECNLLNYVGEPNRFGLPAFYELHVWAWEHNPMGSFADWNTHVTCDHQPVSAAGTAAR